MKVAPHLVRPLEFLLPVYKHDKPGLFVLDVGLWIYDALSKFSSPKLHRTVRAPRLGKLEPGLKRDGLDGGLLYYDCTTDDARLTLENIIDARALGATDRQLHARREAAARRRAHRRRRGAAGRRRRRHSDGARCAPRSRSTPPARGPTTCGGSPARTAILHASKGVHLVVDAKRLNAAPRGRDEAEEAHRLLHPVGQDRTVIGTTDTFCDRPPEEVHTDAADVAYLLDLANNYFPEAKLDARRRAGDVGRRAAAHQARQRRGDGVGRVARAPHPRAAGPRHHRRRQADHLSTHGGRGRRPRGQAARRAARRAAPRRVRCRARPSRSIRRATPA